MSKGVFEIALGVALIAADVLFLGANPELIAIGASLITGGVGTLLTKQHSGLSANVLNPIQPWNVIYGQAKVGGTVVFIAETGESDKYLHYVFVLACHPCQSLDAIYFDSKRLPINTDGNSVSFGDSTATTGSQQTVDIQSISRSGDVVTVVMVSTMPQFSSNSDVPPLLTGDTVQIQNVNGDQTLNGQYQIQLVNTNQTTFTYICGGSPVTLTNQGQVRTTWPDYGDTVNTQTALGTQASNPFPKLSKDTPLWTEQHVLQGHTAIYIRLKYGGDTYASGVPTVSFLVSGKNDVYDPRAGTNGYTANSALCIADYLTHPIWGFKADRATKVRDAMVTAAANVCDEAVALANGDTEPRYTCNGSFQLSVTRGEILQNLLTSCAGRLTYSGGQYTIWPAAWYGSTSITYKQDGSLDYGNSLALYQQGDWSAGLWINLPIGAHGSLLGMGNAGSSDSSGAAYAYLLAVAGSGPYSIIYSHDYDDGSAGGEGYTFPANIQQNAWTYLGVSRNATAKTVTLYVGDGTNLTSVGVFAYSHTPGSPADASSLISHLTLGKLDYGNFGATPNNSNLYPAISIISSVAMWSAALTQSQLQAAMTGSLPTSGLIFDVTDLGASPSSSVGGYSPTVNGTTVVPGPGSVGARLFGESVPTASTIDGQHLAGPYQWKPKVAIRDLFNGVKATYVCPANSWQPSDMPPYAQDASHGYGSDANLAADGGDRRWLELQFPFTISTAMAQRLAKIELLRRRQQGSGTFVFNLAMYGFSALDVVQMTLPYLGWSAKTLEITNHRFTIAKQDAAQGIQLGTELDLQETDPSVYEWSATEELTAQGGSQGSSGPQTVAAPTGVTATNSTVTGTGITTGQLQVSWTAPTDGYVTQGGQTIVQYSLDDVNWIALGTYDSSTTTAFIPNVAKNQEYWVRVAFLSTQGLQSPWTVYGPINAQGSSIDLHYADDETPSGAMDGTNQTFTLAHTPNPSASLALYFNGDLQIPGVDFTLSTATITLLKAKPVSAQGDTLVAFYRH